MIDAEGTLLLHELCAWAESRPLEIITRSVQAILDGSRQRQYCRHGCERWRVRPADDWAPDYWLCAEANVYYGQDWAGPSGVLDRAISGERATYEDYCTDESPWTMFRVLPDVIELLTVGNS